MRIFITIAMAVFAMLLSAEACAQESQQYEPMLQDGTVFMYFRYGRIETPEVCGYYTSTVVGDDTIDGIQCKKVVINEYGKTHEEYWREEDGVVYLYTITDTEDGTEWKFVPMMNFNLNKGDSVDNSTYVKKVDYVETLDGVRKRITLHGMATFPLVWIEGIGANNEVAYITAMPLAGTVLHYLVGCYRNDMRIFSYEDFFKESTSAPVIKAETPVENNVIYNLDGNKISEPYPGQVYITDGKKKLKTQ